jgi:hypothetical protein
VAVHPEYQYFRLTVRSSDTSNSGRQSKNARWHPINERIPGSRKNNAAMRGCDVVVGVTKAYAVLGICFKEKYK